ncbi:MAG: phenylalanine--tRNA ligase subunit beta [Candidatus Pacebacteria bacterium]|nr:phenylalanine--tRNA ligase subunit beta [Candidatus Paceibacterota bacterium]
MIFSYNWLQQYIKEKLPKPEKLAELLAEHFTEVEEVKKTSKDVALDIGVKPNRAGDCFSHIGIAREISAICNLKLVIENTKLKEDKKLQTKDFINIKVQDKNVCPRYTTRVITDIKIDSSPEWLKQKLNACGLQSINNVVDIANYIMLETGQPLHAFDLEKLQGRKLIIRFAKKGEKITTLDNQKFDLNENILVIADDANPVAIAGIKGGKGPEIDKNTKTIVLESANFNPKVIRQGSKALNLKTDASWRFEHGIDPNMTEYAINRAIQLIQELAGGRIAKDLVDFYSNKIKPKKIYLEIDHIEKILGIKIPLKEIKRILKSLDFKIIQDSKSKIQDLIVEIPTFRLDIFIAEDLIEEIGRLYGYAKIPAVLPKVSIIPGKRNLEIFWEDFIKNTLKESGFTEVYNYSFINKKNSEMFDYKENEIIEIENPISSEYQYLAPLLIPNLLENVKNNFKYFDKIKIFELGKVFNYVESSKNHLKIEEKRNLTGLIAEKQGKELFYEIKGVIDSLLEKMGVSNLWYDEYCPTPEKSKISIWNAKKCAEIKIDKQEIGFLGEIPLKILNKLKIKGKVVVFDIDFDKLQKLSCEECEFRPISAYPSSIRDLSILIPKNTKVAEVLNVINQSTEKLIRDVDLFDIYEGEELPQGKKNLAFHIIYQAENRTLTSQEINKAHQKIIKALERNLEWEVRK